MKKLPIALSACPNDTFAFDAWVHKKIASTLHPEPTLADIQQLNAWAYGGRFGVIKVSTFCLGKITDHYKLLPCGAAISSSGPKIISKTPFALSELSKKRLLVPGLDTTAFLLCSCLCPEPLALGVCRYDEMLTKLREDEADAALIIHETRFTFEKAGFVEIADLGQLFSYTFDCPVPLGVVVAKKEVYNEAAIALRASIEYGLNNPASSKKYVLNHSQEKDEAIIQEHIRAYVTDETLQISSNGLQAIKTLFQIAIEKKLLPKKCLEFHDFDLLCHA